MKNIDFYSINIYFFVFIMLSSYGCGDILLTRIGLRIDLYVVHNFLDIYCLDRRTNRPMINIFFVILSPKFCRKCWKTQNYRYYDRIINKIFKTDKFKLWQEVMINLYKYRSTYMEKLEFQNIFLKDVCLDVYFWKFKRKN